MPYIHKAAFQKPVNDYNIKLQNDESDEILKVPFNSFQPTPN